MVGAVAVEIERVDPALRDATQKLARTDPSKAWMRTVLRLATRVMPVPRTEAVSVSTVRSGRQGLRLYQPDRRAGNSALLWIHGGGLLFGDARQDEVLCAETARELGIPVFSANYRFAPEHPFPAALDDVHAAWHWVRIHAAGLGVDPDRIVVGGESAGAGLAASLVQLLHDHGGAQPVAQWLFAPMIDDRTAVDESLDALDHWVWNNRINRVGWGGYLGGRLGQNDPPPYAAAARRTDLSDLPPAYLAVGDIELFFAENQDYARRLAEAGTEVHLDVVPGAPHGFENWGRDTAPARALMKRARGWLREVLARPDEGRLDRP